MWRSLNEDGGAAAPASSCNMMRLNEAEWPALKFYVVTPGVSSGMYAGEHPMRGGDGSAAARERSIKRFLDFGVDFFLDLTEQGEALSYTQYLPQNVWHHQFPIHEGGAPESVHAVVQLFNSLSIHYSYFPHTRMYIHCADGKGRTGMMAACYKIYCGMTYDDAVSWLYAHYRCLYHLKPSGALLTRKQLDFIRMFACKTA